MKHKEKSLKKALSDSFLIGVLTIFGLILIVFIFEKVRLIIPMEYSKPMIVGVSILTSGIYFLKQVYKWKRLNRSNNNVTRYTFSITDYYSESISNTEFVIYACKTTNNLTVVFQTSELLADNILDTLNIILQNGKIVSMSNYSTGKKVSLLNLNVSPQATPYFLIQKYR